MRADRVTLDLLAKRNLLLNEIDSYELSLGYFDLKSTSQGSRALT